jgi:hypothetical protein
VRRFDAFSCVALTHWKFQQIRLYKDRTVLTTSLPDRGSLDRISLDRISWSNFLIKRLKSCHLIKLFDQVKKSVRSFLALDQKF